MSILGKRQLPPRQQIKILKIPLDKQLNIGYNKYVNKNKPKERGAIYG